MFNDTFVITLHIKLYLHTDNQPDLINPNKLSVYYALSTFFNCSKNAFSEKKEPIFLNVLLQSLQARVMIVLDKNNSTMKDRKVGPVFI